MARTDILRKVDPAKPLSSIHSDIVSAGLAASYFGAGRATRERKVQTPPPEAVAKSSERRGCVNVFKSA